MNPVRDDYELTLNELKSQRLQLTLNLEVVEAGISALEKRLKILPKKKDDPKINSYNEPE